MSHDIPLPDDVLDELLSAELDGELDAAAADHGFSLAEARLRVEATPGSQRRRDALRAARDAMTVEPLDDLTRRRLLGAASAGAPADVGAKPAPGPLELVGRSRWLRVAGGIAAAVLLVVAAAAVLSQDFGDDGEDTGSEVAADAGASLDLELVPLDSDVSDPDQLRQVLEDSAGARAAAEDAQESEEQASEADGATEEAAGLEGPRDAGDDPADAADLTSPADELISAESDTGESTAELGDATSPVPTVDEATAATCVAAFQDEFDRVPIALFSAIHGDQPALVVLFEDDGGRGAIVYNLSSCTELEFQSIR